MPIIRPVMPRFGWFDHTHHHIEDVAVNRLASAMGATHPWPAFLSANMAWIHKVNDMQDTHYKGKHHFLDMPNKGNQPGKTLQSRFFSEISDLFSASRKQQYLREMRLKPLVPGDAKNDIPSVLTAVVQGYNDLVDRLKLFISGQAALNREGKKDPVGEEIFLTDIKRNVAELSHYVSDACVPMHTISMDWPIGGRSDKFMHQFFEGDVLTPADFSRVSQNAWRRQKPLPRMSRETVENTILHTLQQSFLKIFKIVEIQQKTIQEFPRMRSIKVYEDTMADRLKKQVVLPQMIQSQELLAGLLQSAWQEASAQAV